MNIEESLEDMHVLIRVSDRLLYHEAYIVEIITGEFGHCQDDHNREADDNVARRFDENDRQADRHSHNAPCNRTESDMIVSPHAQHPYRAAMPHRIEHTCPDRSTGMNECERTTQESARTHL